MNNMVKVTKRPFIAKLAEKGYTLKEASDIYKAFVDSLIEEVLKGNEVMLTGFGRFSLKLHKGHPIKFTDTPMPDYLVLKFVASNTLSKNLRTHENNENLIKNIKNQNKKSVRKK